MNPIFFLAFMSGALVSAYPSYNDGQWKGEGLAESQDNAHFHNGYSTYNAPLAYSYGAYVHGAAPLGHDGRVVDTHEVAHAKAAHFATKAAASQGSWAYAAGAYAPATNAAWSPVETEGQWKGKGLAESQDNGLYNNLYSGYHGRYAGGNDGQWKGEGLIESRDNANQNGQYSSGYGYPLISHENDGQWKGEGLLESQDNGDYKQGYAAYGAYAPALYSHGNDGQWRGEGIAESQDNGQWNSEYAIYGGYGVYAHGGAPIGHDGRVVDTPEVAHAKAAHFAAKVATGGHHGSW